MTARPHNTHLVSTVQVDITDSHASTEVSEGKGDTSADKRKQRCFISCFLDVLAQERRGEPENAPSKSTALSKSPSMNLTVSSALPDNLWRFSRTEIKPHLAPPVMKATPGNSSFNVALDRGAIVRQGLSREECYRRNPPRYLSFSYGF